MKSFIVAGLVILADIAIAGVVYYITPYHNHMMAPRATSYYAQPAIAAIFGIIAVICIIAAVMVLMKSPGQKK
jgi:hypothetical protein